MDIQSSQPTQPAQDDPVEPPAPELPANLPAKLTKSSVTTRVTTRSQRAKKALENIPLCPSPNIKGGKRAADQEPATEPTGLSDPGIDASLPPKKKAKTRAKRVKADPGAEKRRKTLATEEASDSTDPAADVNPPPKKAKTQAKRMKADPGAQKKAKTLPFDENPATEAPGLTDSAANVSSPSKEEAKIQAKGVKVGWRR